MLYHISEEPDIEQFVPRESGSLPHLSPVVWAMDEDHIINYLFPRDCPRIVYSLSPEVNDDDRKLFFEHTLSQTIIAVENSWYERIRNTGIYKYGFDPFGFELLDRNAGYYIAKQTVKPISIERIDDLIGTIISLGVELRFTPNLWPLRDAILTSTITKFSIIRFRNALPLESVD
ncbi:DUF6886 family protein [Cohnella lupini]|uniref:Uncharacterized protein n=1 Tax=Cohnella lupini TaxID=1294267 RepID=A0A3D9IWR8_9BACL|nr:DUF6886 family protein [Cohnella lupini]RED66192.1 hypothetical protein DFP95_101690 [Cohnella lupini]